MKNNHSKKNKIKLFYRYLVLLSQVERDLFFTEARKLKSYFELQESKESEHQKVVLNYFKQNNLQSFSANIHFYIESLNLKSPSVKEVLYYSFFTFFNQSFLVDLLYYYCQKQSIPVVKIFYSNVEDIEMFKKMAQKSLLDVCVMEECKEDKSLISGLFVAVGDKAIDLSLKNKIKDIANKIFS